MMALVSHSATPFPDVLNLDCKEYAPMELIPSQNILWVLFPLTSGDLGVMIFQVK
jgi:hypothetical protein